MNVLNKATCLLLGLVLAITFFLNFCIFKVDSTVAHLSTFSLVLLILILYRVKGFLSLSVAVILSYLLILQIIYTLLFGEKISPSVLDSIVETNKVEIIELSGHLFFKLLVPSIVITIFFSMLMKSQKEFSRFVKILPVFIFLVSVVLTFKKVDARLISDIKEDNKEVGVFLRNKYPAVIGDLIYLYTSSITNDKYGDINEIKNFDDSIKGVDKNKKRLVVFIIGESSLSKRYSSYGYGMDTTLRMSQIFSSNGACIIENAHSSAPITRNSLSMSLSFHTPESEEKLFSRKSIIEMAQSNGYKTYWLGAQELTGIHSSKYGFIAKKSQKIINTNAQDDKLSKQLKNILSESGDFKFIVIHLKGSHIPYNNFDDLDKKALPSAEDYDLTIHHTDRVINDIYHVVESSLSGSDNYSLIYTSDHGEIVGKGHGYPTGKDQYLIPFMYKSNTKQDDCSFIESFKNKEGNLSGLMNKYILSSLIGYQIDDLAIEKEKNNDRVLSAEDIVIPYFDIK